jgi:hypothetical protein
MEGGCPVKRLKISWVWQCILAIPATWKAEAEEMKKV